MKVAAIISLNKVDNFQFKDFMETFAKRTIPITESTLGENYLSVCYIRNKIRVSIDESADVIIITHLHADHSSKTFLLTTDIMERANHSKTEILFDNAMKLL